MKRLLTTTAAMALAGAVALVGGGALTSQAQPAPAPTSQVQPPLEQLTGDAFDRAFLAQMISHHAMAVQMARPAAAAATHQETKDLANAIIADQTREIAQMRGWLKAWYNVDVPDPLATMGSMGHDGHQMPMGNMSPAPMTQMPMGGMDHSGHRMGGSAATPGTGMGNQPMSMGGMDMTADLAKLSPGRLEVVFLSLMIPHHQGAIDMAGLVPSRAAHQELKDLAGNIVNSQSDEIYRMNSWLASWYGL